MEQEPLKSALAGACEQAVNETGGKKMQAKLGEALLRCETGSGFTAGEARHLVEEEGKRRRHDAEVEAARSAAWEAEQALVEAANVAREDAEKEERKRVEAAEVARVAKVEEEQTFASEAERTRVAAEEEERRKRWVERNPRRGSGNVLAINRKRRRRKEMSGEIRHFHGRPT